MNAAAGPGPERDRLLRRADWRFLLPTPVPARTACFASGLLAEAVAAISTSVIDPNGATDCDLAVAVTPSAETLRGAHAALRPGGSCYTEWPIPTAGGPGGVRKRLEAAGFTGVQCYLPWPWPSRAPARFWIPLDDSGAISYWFHSRPLPRGTRQRLFHLARRSIGYLLRTIRPALPVCAVAHKPRPSARGQEPVRDGEENVSVARTMQRKWKTFDLGPLPYRLSWLLLTGGPRSTSKVVGLVFPNRDKEPLLAVKMPRVPGASRGLRREVTNLRALHASAPGGVPGAPRVLFTEEFGGLQFAGQTAVPGTPIGSLVRRESYGDLAFSVTRWLVDLAGNDQPSPPEFWWARLVDPVFTDLYQYLAPITGRAPLEESERIVRTLGPLPLVREHRDFGPHNIHIDRQGKVGVLDWENAELQGLPGLDLIYFLAFLGFYLDSTPTTEMTRASYRRSLDPQTLTGSVREQCLRYYAGRLHLDPSSLPALRLLTWLVHCRWLCRHLAEEGGALDAGVLQSSTVMAIWAEELSIQSQ